MSRTPDYRGPQIRRSRSVALDPLTPILLLVFVGMCIAVGARMHWHIAENAELLQKGVTPTVIWTGVGVGIVLFFVIVVPLVFLGIFITAKIMRFELPGGAFLRAGSVAAAPAVVLGLQWIVPDNPVVKILIWISIVPVGFYITKYIFEIEWLDTLVAAVFCVPFFAIGVLATSFIIGATLVSGVAANQASASSPQFPGISSIPSIGNTQSSSQSPATPVDRDQQRLDGLARSVERAAITSTDRTSREESRARLLSLQDEAEKLRAAKGSTEQWQQISRQLADLATKSEQLPSEKADESIYQPLVADQAWTAESQDEEISFGPVNLRPSADLRLDLQASTPQSLSWHWKNSSSQLTLKSVPAADTRQRRPWIIPSWLASRVSSSQKVFSVESNQDKPAVGTLGSDPFVRVETGQDRQKKIIYAGLIDGNWITATVSASGDAQIQQAMEIVVATMHKRSPGAAVADPLAPSRIIPRLADDPEHAMAILKRSGPEIEGPLLAVVAGNDAKLRSSAMKLLADVATEKSLPTMRQLATSSDEAVAASARAVLKRLVPNEFDEISIALMDLKGGDRWRKSAALKTLAAAKPDPKRTEVTRALEALVLEGDLSTRGDAAAAMVVWATPDSVPRLIPLLDENANMFQRETGFKVLAATKDKRAAAAIVRWIIKEPEDVVKALSSMGPIAEDSVVPLLKERDNNVRKNAARILQEVGGAKSLQPLTRAAADPRDFSAAEAAKLALEVVRERVKQSKPTTSTTQP